MLSTAPEHERELIWLEEGSWILGPECSSPATLPALVRTTMNLLQLATSNITAYKSYGSQILRLTNLTDSHDATGSPLPAYLSWVALDSGLAAMP
jgi:hypothetical protein